MRLYKASRDLFIRMKGKRCMPTCTHDMQMCQQIKLSKTPSQLQAWSASATLASTEQSQVHMYSWIWLIWSNNVHMCVSRSLATWFVVYLHVYAELHLQLKDTPAQSKNKWSLQAGHIHYLMYHTIVLKNRVARHQLLHSYEHTCSVSREDQIHR